MSIVTLERRAGGRVQTGWGYVRYAPFSDDVLVSAKDVLEVLDKNPKVTPEELLGRLIRHGTRVQAS